MSDKRHRREGQRSERLPEDMGGASGLAQGSADIADLRLQAGELRRRCAETERQLDELQGTAERLRAVFEGSPVAIAEIDRDDRVRMWNPAAERMFGWLAEEVVGGPAPHVPVDRRAELAEFPRLVEVGVPVTGVETVRTRKDGSRVDVEISVAPILDPNGAIASYIAVYSDITERKRHERELQASRARIVQAADAERKRLERNLHDGAQQRLVCVLLALRAGTARLEADPAASKEILEGGTEELAAAMADLRELARGLHPALLTQRGLAPAIRLLADRSPVLVDVGTIPEERFPEPVEAAAYYVVAEALTNVARYSRASKVTVDVGLDGGLAVVDVRDDGVGGADPDTGSGLRGLADRVEALSGRLSVDSPAGVGTRLRAEIPVSP
jgi:PAS domain S-box-containing protein